MLHPMSDPGPTAAAILPAGYTFRQFLGHGAGGWVALAHQNSVGRLVAVKLISGGASNSDAVARLAREGRVLAALSHPAVVTVFDMTVNGDDLALIMEYLPGGSLQRQLDTGSLVGSARIAILADIAAALGTTASHGIAHRDVKPDNVLLRADDSAKLADFGLARLPRAHGGFRTALNLATGTPLYMAPEQIHTPDLDEPSIDSYAFAVLVYRMLLGVHPYAETTVAGVLRAHREDVPIAPYHRCTQFPPAAAEAIVAGMAKNPADRPTPEQLTAVLLGTDSAAWDALVVGAAAVHLTQARQQTLAAIRSSTGVGSICADRLPAPTSKPRPNAAPVPARIATNYLGGLPDIEPEVFRPAADHWRSQRRRRRSLAVILGVVAGVALGMLVILVLRR
jgi:serine/threonine protein kinase